MPVFLLPDFIADLQEHNDAHFARRVLQKTIRPDGGFRPDSDDHPYNGIEDAWIRYVSRKRTAYRVIFLRKGQDIFLFRAGQHSVENNLIGPTEGAMDAAVAVSNGGPEVVATVAGAPARQRPGAEPAPVNRFKRNMPHPQIHREIFSRRNLPHRDIWLVAPFVNGELFAPTKPFGKLLLEQVEDGASVALITAPPKDKSIEWMEKLAERGVGIFVYPRLHSKLYCFVFDENRRYEPGLREGDRYSSLILVGSSNLTSMGMALGERQRNEELCYSVPDNEIGFVEEYVAELMMHGYELPEVRRLLARGAMAETGERKMVMDPKDYYEKANLRDNPFRSNPNFAADPRASIWVGYEKQKKQLDKYLRRSLADQVGNANFLMLYGNYGTGKSHALLWAQNRILHDEKDTFNSVCYFIPTLRKDKGKLTFAGAFLDDIVAKSDLLANVQAYHNFLTECISLCRTAHGLGHEVPAEKVIEILIPPVELNNFAKEIYHCQKEEDFLKLIAPKTLTDYQAMMIFTRLVNLFVHEMGISETNKRRFKKGAYLFIDELDDLERASVKEAREVNDILRHIYDNCPNCFCMVIALSAEISQLAVLFFDYILSRIHRQIELVVLDKDDAVSFVREILNSNRVDPDGEGGFFPFEEAAIETIASQLTEITPRKIVTTMQQVIEEVRLADHDPADGAVSVDFLDDNEIVEEVLGEGGVA